MAKFNLTLTPLKDNGQSLGAAIVTTNQTSRSAAEAAISAVIQARVDTATADLTDQTNLQNEWNA